MPSKQENLSEQLKKIAPHLRQTRSLVRPISQVNFQLTGKDSQVLFDQTRREILKWLSGRSGRPLPDEAWAGESFELEDVGAQHVIAVKLDSSDYWTARLDDADKEVAQRIWTTEVGMAIKDGTILFGARLVCVTRGEDPPFQRSVPGFVRQIIQHGNTMLDGRKVAHSPWVVKTREEVKELVDLLTYSDRSSDVIVFSLPEESENPQETAASADNVHRATLGACHVVVITGPASYYLTDYVGKELSTFMQAIRTYRPGFDPDFDDPHQHPLGLAHRVKNWDDEGPEAYERFLCNQVLARSVSRRDLEQCLPSLTTVRQISAKLRMDSAKEAGKSDKEMLDMAMEEIQKLSKDLKKKEDEFYSELQLAENEKKQYEELANEARSREFSLKRRIEVLERQISGGGDTKFETEAPNNLDNFNEWCQENLAGKVFLHNRAFQAVKKSEYEDISLIYKALLILRDYYVPMRKQGGGTLLHGYSEELKNLGLEDTPTMARTRAGEEGDTYKIQYGGKSCFLDRHLKSGASREPRYCFRLYYFWDEENEMVVVGWLPSHLDTRIS